MEEELRAHIQHRADDVEPSGMDRAEAERRGRGISWIFMTLGHLKPGVTREQAAADSARSPFSVSTRGSEPRTTPDECFRREVLRKGGIA